MKRTRLLIGILVSCALVGAGAPAFAQRPCMPTLNNCPNQTVTTSKIQIGGAGSLSSAGPGFSNPGRLDDGTIAEADYNFSFDRSTGRLTFVVVNQTTTTSSLTAIGFNATSDVTGMALISENDPSPVTWELAFDSNRNDNVVDTHPSLNELKMDGFGRFNVFIGNKGISTGGNGGDGRSILAGQTVTFVIQVSGNISNITACSFSSVGSLIPPGDKIVTAVGRFQRGVQGGSAFIGPCTGGSLLVSMAGFEVLPGDSRVLARWRTASEIDNAGFRVLRWNARSREVVALNTVLIAPEGSPTTGASYEFEDGTAINGVRYFYAVEDFDLGGVNTIHGREQGVPNPSGPPIKLVRPAYEDVAGPSIRFEWRSNARRRSVIEISSDPTFPAGSTLRVAAGGRTSRGLTPREMDEVRRMGVNEEGGVYWRVAGVDARGARAVSDTFFLLVP